ncbi:MAG TPA: sulfatase, partial [Pseudomonadota bacterium]|nr:sulfatase [Pseudomonadota bacterium]
AGMAVWGTPEVWAEGAGAKAPNLLLILVDTLRADAAGEMPRLQEYAQRSGVQFTQAITAATWTRPAVLALLGGDLPSAIGQNAEDMIPKERDRQRFYALDRHLLPRILHEQGFLVSAIGNNFFLLGYPQIGLSLGFDEVADVRHPVLDSPAITRAALQYFARHKRRPFFLQLHYDAPHWPYSPPPEYLARVPARDAVALAGGPLTSEAKAGAAPSFDPQARAYLAEAAYADAEVAKVLAGLQKEGLAERTLVVIFGDHGEVFDPRHNHFVLALKQPTLYHHGWSAYDETLRVPLVIGMPGRLPAGVVVADQVRLTDVAPTILEALGLPSLRGALPGGLGASGQSLVPLIQGEREPAERPAFVEGQNVRALRADGFLYLRRSDPRLQRAPASATASAGSGPVQLVPEELYSLKDDPRQHKNLLIGPRDLAVERALGAMRAAFARNSPPLPEALLPVTHLLLALGGGPARVLAGVISSADAQLSVAGVSGCEVSPLGPGRLEVTLRSGGR